MDFLKIPPWRPPGETEANNETHVRIDCNRAEFRIGFLPNTKTRSKQPERSADTILSHPVPSSENALEHLFPAQYLV